MNILGVVCKRRILQFDLGQVSKTSTLHAGDRLRHFLGIALLTGCIFISILGFAAIKPAHARILTVAVLIDSGNVAGYNENSSNPGEFQRYPERYLEHLQVPYEIFDVAAQNPPADLAERQLILVGHKDVLLSSAWRDTIASAVFAGSGLVNLDWNENIGLASHIQQIFGSYDSYQDNAASTITVPLSVTPDGSTPHYIAGLQRKFRGDPAGDFVYNFHEDENGQIQESAATVLAGSSGTVIAYLGAGPLITATSYGQGRAVQFGTLEYLKADRFGFLMGIDDLFWRSLVWAARKPFVLRGYPRLWAVQMDDNKADWGYRVKDMYNPSLTGQIDADGIGGPWKPTGFIMTNLLYGDERNSVIADIEAGLLEISPHSFRHVAYGNLYWNESNGELSDSQWVTNLSDFLAWEEGDGSTQPIPFLSRSLVGHFWDISDNIGYDAWHTLGFRYLTSILRPGFQNPWFDPDLYDGAERLSPRPFWIYERPPKTTADEDYSFFFADDLVVDSRAGFPARTFYLFSTQFHDYTLYSRPDISWPDAYASGSMTAEESVGMHSRATWRFWSSLAPFQVYTHDGSNYQYSSVEDRRQVIQEVSSWLSQNGARHVFMDEMGDYIYARNKSMLEAVTSDNNLLTCSFSGTTATADGTPIDTQVLVFPDQQSQGISITIPAFSGGQTLTIPLTASNPPTISGVTPDQGPIAGGTQITISGANFLADGELNITGVLVGGNSATAITVIDSGTITATTPAGSTGPADVAVLSDTGTALLVDGFFYIGPPVISSLSPNSGTEEGGTAVTITGQGFETGSTVAFGSSPASTVSYVDSSRLAVITPAGSAGMVDVTVSNSVGSTTYPDGFQYIAPGSLLASDDFNDGEADGWTISPLGGADGWSVIDGVYHYDGSGHTQSYSGDANWSDYTLDVKFRLTTLDNYPGGIRGRVNPDTGAAYAVWLYPGKSQIILWKTTGWNIDSSGLAQLGVASGISFDTSQFHLLGLSFEGDLITVSYDGAAIITTTDASYASGLIALDVSNQAIDFDDIAVSTVGSGGPPTLTGISVTPASVTFSQLLETTQLQVTGQYSDGSTSNLTSDPGTSYTSGNTNVVTTTATGLLTAVADGDTSVTVTNSTISVLVPVSVNSAPVPPEILGVSPSSGPVEGGTDIVITGSGFLSDATVTVGGALASDILVVDANTINAVTPPGAEGDADIVVTTSAGSATLAAGFSYTTGTGGILFSDDFSDGDDLGWTVSPLGGADGWSVIDGVYHYDGSGHTQSYSGEASWSDYALDVKFRLTTLNNYPGGIRGRVNPATGAAYAVWLYPAKSRIILWRTTGWNIDSSGLTRLGVASKISFDTSQFHLLSMSFEGDQITVSYDGAAIITATDASYASGLIALDVSDQVIDFDDIVVSAIGSGEPPTLTGISVTPASVAFSQPLETAQLQVTGQYSDGSTSNLTSDPATSYTSGNTNVVTTTSTGLLSAVADGNTSVTVVNGTLSVLVPVTVATAPAPPEILGVSPSSGPVDGGTGIVISGSGFLSDATVTVGGALAGNIVVVDSNTINAVTPPGSEGSADIVVTTAAGSATLAAGFSYTSTLQLTELQVAPSSVNLSEIGQTRQLEVTGLFSDGSTQALTSDPATSYTSGNTNVVTTTSTGLLSAVADGNTSVTVANGTLSVLVPVTVATAPAPPEILGVSPSSGPVDGGTDIVISGSGFLSDATVTVGGALAGNIVVVDSNTINAVTPPGSEGSADIVVTTAAGSATLAAGFSYTTGTGGLLFSDDFSDGDALGWTISPLGNEAGWSVVSGSYSFDGSGHTQSYAGDAAWQNYTLQVDVQLASLQNYPGGIRGRVDPATGAGYALWLYPAYGRITLWRTTQWYVDSPGLVQLASAGGINFGVGTQHTVSMAFTNNVIEVYFDGELQFTVVDDTISTGLIALDVSNQPISFDNVVVTLSQ